MMLYMGRLAREAAADLAVASTDQKNAALGRMAKRLEAETEKVLDANRQDLEAAEKKGRDAAFLDRLRLDPLRVAGMAKGLHEVAALPDPVGSTIASWTRPNGLEISRVRVPLGVIGMIYESRPNVTADASGLCLKAGNAVILRSGSDSFLTSLVIANILTEAITASDLPASTIQLVPSVDRSAVGFMLGGLDGAIDVIVPRGGKSLVARVQQEARVPVFAHWCEVQRARRVSDWPALEQAARSLLELSPGSHGARGTLARMYMETGRFSEAQACYAQLVELLEDPNAAHWDHMSAASAARDWDAVRRSAKAIGMELSSQEGVVEEPWGWVIIRSEENGEPMEYYARRSGPVTARIVENAPSNRAQQVGDWVVFDAALVHPAPEEEEAREHFIPTYAQVHVLERGGFARSWMIDGAHPGEEAWNVFVEAAEAQGWKVWSHSRPDYTVTDPDVEDGTLPGLLFTVAQPQDHAPLALHRFLQQHTATWPHPHCWLRLAEACNQDRQPHLHVIERYGL